MLFKMLGIEEAYKRQRVECTGSLPLYRPRQVFVTQSRVLADKVEEYYVKLAASGSAALMTAEESAQLAAQQKEREDKGLVDRDEEEFWRGSLPSCFSDLEEGHFPLFITFDHVCPLIDL